MRCHRNLALLLLYQVPCRAEYILPPTCTHARTHAHTVHQAHYWTKYKPTRVACLTPFTYFTSLYSPLDVPDESINSTITQTLTLSYNLLSEPSPLKVRFPICTHPHCSCLWRSCDMCLFPKQQNPTCFFFFQL